MRILITGASGTIGQKLVPVLESDHDLILLSRREVAGDRRWIQADVRDIGSLIEAAKGVDAIVHLAIATGFEGDHEDDAFNQERFDTNLKGTFNVFEAARSAGVGRVVHTSSLTVVWGYPAPEPIAGDALPRPVGTYALTKALAEQVAEHYSWAHGLSVVCLRIPKPIDISDPDTKANQLLPQWIAFPDLLQAYVKALAVPDVGFEIVTVVGESTKRRWDLSKARDVLGYIPEYRLEELGYTLRDEPGSYDGPDVVWGSEKGLRSDLPG